MFSDWTYPAQMCFISKSNYRVISHTLSIDDAERHGRFTDEINSAASTYISP